ncbi:MAG: GAF domain-containing sensor histidine kinase [Chloroflexi bacterium]|nr:GAF domain-containing sensor histidine kinase [Chloroflexota bacterium]
MTPLLWIYLGVYLTIIGLTGWPRLDFRVRAWGLILVGYTNAVASFARLGMAGSGRLYLIAIPVMATIIVGARAGYLTAALSLMIYAAFTLLAHLGVLATWLTLQTNPVNLAYWLEAGAALAVFLITIVVLLERFTGLQSRTLAAKQQVSAQLTEAYQTLEQRVAERTQELATLNAIAAMVSSSLDLQEVMRAALDQTLQVVDMDGGIAYQLDEATQTLVLMAQQGLSESFAQRMSRLPLQLALAGQRVDVTQPIVFHVVRDYPDGDLKNAILSEGLQLVVGVPLVAKGRLVGGLIISTHTPRSLTPDESALLSAVGQQVGIAVENARLYEQAEQVAAVAERSRLARELHDSVTQSLYSMTLYAEAAARLLTMGKPIEGAAHLRELRDTAQEALREMRLLIFELRPFALEQNGLIAALQTRLDAVEVRGGAQVELQVEGQEHLPRIVQEELYHITQEALNNVLKHSKAQHVRVHVQFQNTLTCLEVCDDGLGFDAAQTTATGGLGLRGMRERAQRIGATLQIESAPNQGTRVSIQVPMSAHGNGATK